MGIKGFNDDEILDFARLTLDHPFQIRFMDSMALGEARLEDDRAVPRQQRRRGANRSLGALQAVDGRTR